MLKNCCGRQCKYYMGAGVCLFVYVHHHLPHTQGVYILHSVYLNVSWVYFSFFCVYSVYYVSQGLLRATRISMSVECTVSATSISVSATSISVSATCISISLECTVSATSISVSATCISMSLECTVSATSISMSLECTVSATSISMSLECTVSATCITVKTLVE